MRARYLVLVALLATGCSERGDALPTPLVTPLQFATNELPQAVVGVPYSVNIKLEVPQLRLQWRVSAGQLPPGLTLGTFGATSLLAGRPTEAGTWDVVIAVQGRNQVEASRSFSLVVEPLLPLQWVTTELAPAWLDEPYSAVIEITGGAPAPLRWSFAQLRTQPDLRIEADDRHLRIMGTPSQVEDRNIIVQVRDTQDQFESRTFTFSVAPPAPPPFRIQTTMLPVAEPGIFYRATIAAVGGRPPYYWDLESTPDWLTVGGGPRLDLPLSGLPGRAGPWLIKVRVQDSADSVVESELLLSVAGAPPVAIRSSSITSARVGVNMQWDLQAVGASGRVAWQVAGLPNGVLTTVSGPEHRLLRIEGRPDLDGRFEVEFAVTSDWGPTSLTRTLVVHPIEISSSTLTPGRVGAPYNGALSVLGGQAPHAWSVDSDLPFGLTLHPDGNLRGIPAAGGTYTPTVTVTDAVGRITQRTLHLQIDGSASPLSIRIERPFELRTCAPGGVFLVAEGGAYAGYQWSLQGATLPADYALTQTATTARIGGHTTEAGSYSALVVLSDAQGTTVSATVAFEVTGPSFHWLAAQRIPPGQTAREEMLIDVCPKTIGPAQPFLPPSPTASRLIWSGPAGLRFSEAGEHLLVPFGAEIQRLDVSGPTVAFGQALTQASADTWLVSFEVDATATRIAYYYGIRSAQTEGLDYREVTTNGPGPVHALHLDQLGLDLGSFSPTGLALAFKPDDAADGLTIAQFGGPAPVLDVVWLNAWGSSYQWTWTPDGQRLLLNVNTSSGPRLFEVDLNGPRPLVPSEISPLSAIVHWRVSPDSRWLAIIRPGGYVDLHRLGTNSPGTALHPGVRDVNALQWSPQGDKLAYTGKLTATSPRQPFVVPVGAAGAGQPVTLPTPARWDGGSYYRWSPDGQATYLITYDATTRDQTLTIWTLSGPPLAHRYPFGQAGFWPQAWRAEFLWLSKHERGQEGLAVIGLRNGTPGAILPIEFPVGFIAGLSDPKPWISSDGRRAFLTTTDGNAARLTRVLLDATGHPMPAEHFGPPSSRAWQSLDFVVQPR